MTLQSPRGNRNRKTILDRIGKKWRESVGKVKEYEVIKKEETDKEFTPFCPSGVDSQEYLKAEKLKKRLLKKYKGKALEDVIEGREFKTKKGVCYHIEDQDRIDIKSVNPEHARKKILSELKLIHGVGGVKERVLKEEGYETIEDLTEHPRFGSEAKRLLKIINKRDTCRIIDQIGHWFPKSHPLILSTSDFHREDDFIIFDIETMGLSNVPIVLLGIAQISGGRILLNQYFLRNIKEEPAALMGFLSRINKNGVFITFNGKTFDIPYVRQRLAYYGMNGDLNRPHFDILHFSRREWREKVPNCRLVTLEKHLFGVERKDDVPSALVPEFYEAYMKTGNIGPVIPIIEHNKQDLLTLASIFSKLREKWG